MSSLDDKLHSLTGKVADLDTTNYEHQETSSSKNYSQYIYIVIIFFIIFCVLLWLKPSFLTYTDSQDDRVYVNKTRMGAATFILTGSLVGGWYWYSKR